MIGMLLGMSQKHIPITQLQSTYASNLWQLHVFKIIQSKDNKLLDKLSMICKI